MGNIRTIDFHGDPLLGFQDERGVFIALRPMVQGMGLNWSGQLQRIKRDQILSEAVCVMHTGSDTEGVCLPLDLVPGFLFRIDTNRIANAAVRAKVLDYQRSCFAVLASAFLGRSEPPPAIASPAIEVPTGAARKLVSECRQTFGVLPARELWFSLGLPRVPSMHDRSDQFSLFSGEWQRQHVRGSQP